MVSSLKQSPLSVPIHKQNMMCDFRMCQNITNLNNARFESQDENHEQTILEREMDKLSIHEKKKLHRGIMGDSVTSSTILQRWSGDGLAEGPVFLKLKIAELDNHIHTRIASKQGGRSYEAYQMAVAQDEDYVNRPEFKVTFLRATRYNTKKATTKILWYFDMKLELFGPTVMGRDICWDDLCSEARVYMESGVLQLLPKRDKFGRKIIFWSDTFGPKVLTPGEVLGMVSNVCRTFSQQGIIPFLIIPICDDACRSRLGCIFYLALEIMMMRLGGRRGMLNFDGEST